jgi:hypothetical protein
MTKRTNATTVLLACQWFFPPFLHRDEAMHRMKLRPHQQFRSFWLKILGLSRWSGFSFYVQNWTWLNQSSNQTRCSF